MLKIIAPVALAFSLSGCATLMTDNPLISDADIARDQARQREFGRLAQARADNALAKGAMDPWDRAEVEIYHLYLDSKYPDANTPPK